MRKAIIVSIVIIGLKKVVVIPDENKYQDWIKNNEELMQGMVTSEIFKGMK